MNVQSLTKTKTSVPKPAESAEQWYVLDADGQILGRLSTAVAGLLRGKHQPNFAPHVPTNNHVIIINAATIRVTGNKLEDKRYHRHSGRPGGLKSRTLAEELERHPTRPVEKAIERMLPDNRLRAIWICHLHVYEGAEHPHLAQQPTEVGLDG